MTTRKPARWIAAMPKRDERAPVSRYSIAGRSAPHTVRSSNVVVPADAPSPTARPPTAPAQHVAARPGFGIGLPTARSLESERQGMGADRARRRMVERIAARGVRDAVVLEAMDRVPRHLFVDPGFASRAYEDSSWPIGHGQTISQPFIVARMLELARNGGKPAKWLEIGTGCGYQAAVMACIVPSVISIERIRALHELARLNLRALRLSELRLHYGDGRAGYPGGGPYEGIVMAAAGIGLPPALLEQLAIGGRLVAPVTGEGGEQRLVCVDRRGPRDWRRVELDVVHFVPLRSGTTET